MQQDFDKNNEASNKLLEQQLQKFARSSNEQHQQMQVYLTKQVNGQIAGLQEEVNSQIGASKTELSEKLALTNQKLNSGLTRQLIKVAKTIDKNRQGVLLESPFAQISFDEAFSSNKIAERTADVSLNKLNSYLRKTLENRNISRGIQLVDSVRRAVDFSIVWELSDKGKEMLKTGEAVFNVHKATGKLLPTIKNAENQRFVELLKGSGPDALSKVGQFSNVIVNAAHIISGADLIKQIRKIDKKVSLLLEGRRNDKIAKLEANYIFAQELLSNPVSIPERMLLLNLHRELIELRSAWRRDIDYQLNQINDPKKPYKWFDYKWRQNSKDKKLYEEISEFETELLCLYFAYIYDMALCAAINHPHTLQDEILQLKQTHNLLTVKAKFIDANKPKLSAEPHCQFMAQMITQLDPTYALNSVNSQLVQAPIAIAQTS